jgi:hypothetical protein
MQSIQFAGSWYKGIGAAAAWAATALPDTSVVTDEEDPGVAAENLEAFWWGEAAKIGEGAPEGVSVHEWRFVCRMKLVERIERSRKVA